LPEWRLTCICNDCIMNKKIMYFTLWKFVFSATHILGQEETP
jgi:hypothetical protein